MKQYAWAKVDRHGNVGPFRGLFDSYQEAQRDASDFQDEWLKKKGRKPFSFTIATCRFEAVKSEVNP